MRREALILLAGAALAALPWAAGTYWVGLMTQALIFGAFALSLDILAGFTSLPSIGHAAFFGLAGYGAALAVTRWGIDPWAAAAIGILFSVLVALAFGPLAVRLRGLAFLTVTLAFAQVAWGLATRWTSFTGGENGIPSVTRPSLALLGWDLTGPSEFYWFTLFWVVLLTLLIHRFANSAVGMSLLGIRESDRRMAALGYNVQARRTIAFVLAAAAGAVVGVLSAYYNKFIGPGSLDWRLSAQMLLSVIIGGAGSLWGPFIAGTGLHVLKTNLIGETERWVMVLGILYVVTVVLIPKGLASLPRIVRAKLWRQQPKSPAEKKPPRPAAPIRIHSDYIMGDRSRSEEPALEARGISVHFGGLQALQRVDLKVMPGTRHGILGPNGAGKTTLFNVLTGFVKPSEGRVFVHGVDITALPTHKRVGLGLVRTLQITTLFPELTAMENVLIGTLVGVGHHRNLWRRARSDRQACQAALGLLHDLGLEYLAETKVAEIGYGEQRQLEIAVALAPRPRLLLLDEPTAGLSAAETRSVLELLQRLPQDLTLVIIEHDLEVVFEIADHLTVLHYGERIADGPSEVVRRDPVVREVYIGSR